jgi:hypothetical protein
MSYPITLGGLTFDVPALPWRLTKKLQPELLAWVGAHDVSAQGALNLSEGDLDGLAGLVFAAVRLSPQGRAMTEEALADLPATTLEMAAAVAPVLQACGLELKARGEAADPKA